jgi:hypothetical protein
VSGGADNATVRVVIAFVLLLALLFGAQALAAANAPAGGVASTGRIIGQTGFAYLGGLRTFAAAVIWNRLDPIFDGYYQSFDKSFQVFLPEVHLVQVLDPQFQSPYYVTSYWLLKSGRGKDGVALAELGFKNNPNAGLMYATLDQLLFLDAKGKVSPRMLELARVGVSDKVTWLNSDDQYEGYGIFGEIMKKAGNKAAVVKIRDAQRVLKANGTVAGVSIETTAPVPSGQK